MPNSVRNGIMILSLLCAAQLLWHWALAWNNSICVHLLSMYLYADNIQYRKDNVAVIIDFFLPAIASGIAFGWMTRRPTLTAITVFAIATGASLALLLLVYKASMPYTLWWLRPGPGQPGRLLTGRAMFSSAFCGFCALVGRDWQGSRDRRKARKPTSL
jgi:hypothetical protein